MINTNLTKNHPEFFLFINILILIKTPKNGIQIQKCIYFLSLSFIPKIRPL